MSEEFSRTELLLGKDAMEKLNSSIVAVFGIGGVGSFTAEALARSGIGNIDLFDDDSVCITNINRQLIATHSTVGQKKVFLMSERIADINPNCNVNAIECFYSKENSNEFDFKKYDYIVDAIDTVSSKLLLIENAKEAGVPIISCMGAGNKMNPTQFEVADIYETSVCPLAKVMRKELKLKNIDSLKVVYSKEQAIKPTKSEEELPPDSKRRQIPGSVSFVPSVAGLIIASEVIKDLIGY